MLEIAIISNSTSPISTWLNWCLFVST